MFDRFPLLVVSLVAASLFVGACEGGDGSAGTRAGVAACEPSVESVTALLAARCAEAGCHAAAEPAVGLDLESPGTAARLVEQAAATCDRTLVVPGDSELSFLYEKVTSSAPSCGAPMPVGAPLPEDELACIRSWIAGLSGGCETCGGSGCADLQADVLNCGDCDVVCPTGATCSSGVCACGPAETACGAECVDTGSNPAACGSCERSCPPVQVCSLGDCKNDCDGGLSNCSAACVDLQSDANHCGDCGQDCGSGTCVGGVCDCGPGIDTQTDTNNCGTCGNVCPPGQVCEAGACVCGNASVSFSAVVQPILVSTCATIGCHRSPMPKEGMNLSAGSAYGALVDVAASQCDDGRLRVAPGDPANSYLVDKILGVDLCSGSKMPKMSSVPVGDLEAISNWICGGALDN